MNQANSAPAESAGRDAVERKSKRFSLGLLALIPVLVIVIVFGLYPVLVLILRSFGIGEVGIYETSGPTLQYYKEALGSAFIARSVRNSVIVGLGSVVITVVLAIPTVLYLAKRSRENRAQPALDALLTFPITLPGIIIGFFSIVLLGRNGLIGQFFPPLAGAAFTYLGFFIAYVFFSVPRIVGPLRGAAEMLNPEYAEAAETLGASRFRAFWTIQLPLILPAAIEASGTAAAVALGGYGTAATLSEGIRLLPLDVVDALNNGFNIATSSALAVILASLALLAIVAGRLLARLVESGLRK
ncbi:Molybdenum transport system permease protein ModB [Corynebacterium glaucum]|uniref:ABC transporter permease n=1 Tax=Corynebacterium glaucum TaxID=187491 RepID=UPI0025B452D1|nr:ABC transporter permease subunit [Corynebacterium glaucum]WJZ08770.1 Molybdenum transport system permease protein ModB [Corynebacterium glaucum]